MLKPLAIAGAAAALIALSVEAQAISRYQSASMSCGRIQATIRAEGAAIFRWRQPPNISRYGRFVAHNGYCDPHERAEATTIPAADTPSCPVRECRNFRREDDPFYRLLRPRLN